MKISAKKQSKRVATLDTYNAFAKRVIAWHTKYGRHTLPWRKSITPYRVLVSEIMLQQTQVSRVLDKFTLWMKRYPTLARLREVELKEVLVLWQGLGYQRRAKALLAIAKATKQLHNSKEALIALPGVGSYTAAAVQAFAFNTWGIMLETNIKTALIEEFHPGDDSITDALLSHDLRRLIELPVVRRVGARVWYSALMDYGAHLKAEGISHNGRVSGYAKQSAYAGSHRKVRAEVLFAITHSNPLPNDSRVPIVLNELKDEGFIIHTQKSGWRIA